MSHFIAIVHMAGTASTQQKLQQQHKMQKTATEREALLVRRSTELRNNNKKNSMVWCVEFPTL